MSPWFRFGRTCCGICRRLVVATAVAAYVATCVGLPFPMRVSKRGGGRFPCEDHACGCATAQECWEYCCCYTPRQKLAWAKAHGVTPPGFVLAQVQREMRRACCRAHGSPRACCKSHHRGHDGESVAGKSPGKTVWVLTSWSRQCKGMADYWTGCPPSLPPSAISMTARGSSQPRFLDNVSAGPLHDRGSPPNPPPEVLSVC